MHKNILYSILLTVFTLGMYGCSCSQANKSSEDLAPGLYLSELSVAEGSDGGKTTVSLNVTLEREDSNEVTVKYSISAIDPTDRTPEEVADFAVVGTADTPEVDVIAVTDRLITFASGSTTATVSIELDSDTIYEHDEKFLVSLSAASAGVEIVKGSVEAVIKNDDDKPIVSLSTLANALSEVFTGVGMTSPANTEITLSLDKVSRVDAVVTLVGSNDPTSDNSKLKVGQTATYRADYLLLQDNKVLQHATPIIIPAGATEVIVELEVVDDGVAENEENFYLTLAIERDAISYTNLAELGFLITDNDTDSVKFSKVNDTGLTEIPNGLDSSLVPAIDSKNGLDQQLSSKTGGGRAGFDYTKLSSTGEPLVPQTTEPNESIKDENGNIIIPWDCVKDNVSGLVWEVKTRGNIGVRSEAQEYYWYDPNYETNGGVAGAKGNNECTGDGLKGCNTAYYVADINHMKLCGMTGWRLPTIEELRTLVDFGVTSGSGPTIPPENVKTVAYDTDYFAGDLGATRFIWSSTTDAHSQDRARVIRFRTPVFEESGDKTVSAFHAIRLVNDSQTIVP